MNVMRGRTLEIYDALSGAVRGGRESVTLTLRPHEVGSGKGYRNFVMKCRTAALKLGCKPSIKQGEGGTAEVRLVRLDG